MLDYKLEPIVSVEMTMANKERNLIVLVHVLEIAAKFVAKGFVTLSY